MARTKPITRRRRAGLCPRPTQIPPRNASHHVVRGVLVRTQTRQLHLVTRPSILFSVLVEMLLAEGLDNLHPNPDPDPMFDADSDSDSNSDSETDSDSNSDLHRMPGAA